MLDTLLPALSADAAHMKLRPDTASVFGVWAQDSNKHLICLALMAVYDTENKQSWTTLLTEVKDHYGNIDTAEMVCIADGDKGFRGAFDDVMLQGASFLCAHHKVGNLAKQSGTTKLDASLFWRAVYSSTVSQLNDVLAEMSQSAQQYLAKTAAEELYLVHVQGRTGGKSSSQLAEAGNSTLLDMRQQQLGNGLLTFLRNDFARMAKNAKTALAMDPAVHELTPKHRKQLDSKITFNTAKGWNLSARFDPDRCVVTSLSDPTKSYTLKLEEPGSCSCGESLVKAVPCDHEVFAARTANRDPAALYPRHRTVNSWRSTYEAMVC
jgi:hypothetical protein